MNFKELEASVMRAIDMLYAFDSTLISQGTAEWSLAHRLAVYLERELPGWNVDCEYNRQGHGPDSKKLSHGSRVRPDIILHHRGHPDIRHNLLAIEIKKDGTASDYDKVCEYTKSPTQGRTYQYQFGLALGFDDGPELHWYSRGENVPIRAGKRARG